MDSSFRVISARTHFYKDIFIAYTNTRLAWKTPINTKNAGTRTMTSSIQRQANGKLHVLSRDIVTSPETVTSPLNVSKMKIYRLMICLKDTGTRSERPSSRRTRATTLRQNRQIRLIRIRKRFVTVLDSVKCILGRVNNMI